MTAKWERVGANVRFVTFARGVAFVCAAAVAVIILAGLGETLLLLVAFLLVWGLLAVRLSLMGLYATASDVRRRGVLSTQTMPWSSVSSVSDTQIVMKDGSTWAVPAEAVAGLRARLSAD
ncbi:hypothetical protein LWC34_36960 [Kibdelosporangium philippinense]|uniref:PH domain-containing protein n=1 Tax=Kibdelosporangium philippinense TaxID=211113 RepID=A0ABS8ZKN8_9PSEU|nr:hypothetical protein [Kibdelosporangium philippinense]MCE7008363.1 hypothetical protein [Kibdelosporangium philippinense]